MHGHANLLFEEGNRGVAWFCVFPVEEAESFAVVHFHDTLFHYVQLLEAQDRQIDELVVRISSRELVGLNFSLDTWGREEGDVCQNFVSRKNVFDKKSVGSIS